MEYNIFSDQTKNIFLNWTRQKNMFKLIIFSHKNKWITQKI